MKNKTIAIIGIGSYLLSVVASASDDSGNFVSPSFLIVLSGIVTIVFVILAAIRLWKEARFLSIMLVSSEIILDIFTLIQVNSSPAYGSPIIILLNLTKVIHLIAFIWVIIKLFKMKSDKSPSLSELKNQIKLADDLYRKDPKFALQIAMGEKDAPEGILPVVIYAKVCDETEKSEDVEQGRQIANSFRNTNLSAEAQKLKLRDPYSAIEAAKQVVNARIKAIEKTLPKGKTFEMAVEEEVAEIKKELEKAKPNRKEIKDFIDSLSHETK